MVGWSIVDPLMYYHWPISTACVGLSQFLPKRCQVKVDLILQNEARRGPQNMATNNHQLRPPLMMWKQPLTTAIVGLWHFYPIVSGQGRFQEKTRLGGPPKTWPPLASIKAIPLMFNFGIWAYELGYTWGYAFGGKETWPNWQWQ